MPAHLPPFRRAARSLVRAPGFTAVVALTLGLAVGAVTAMWAVVDVVLLRALPLDAPERVVSIAPVVDGDAQGGSPALLAEWGEGTRTLAMAAAAQERAATLQPRPGDAALPERLAGLAVSGGFARTLGVGAALGRTLEAGDDRPGAAPVVVLAHRTWRTQLAGDPHVVGRAVVLDGVPHTVIGVLPPALDAVAEVGAFWVPLALAPSQRTNFTPYLTLVGRLREGASVDAAARELGARAAALPLVGATPPAAGRRATVAVQATPLLRALTDGVRRPLLLLLAATLAVLGIAAANVTTLVLARTLARRRELAVRAALGAGRARLAGELTAEHLLLGALAAAVALPVAALLATTIARAAGEALPRAALVGAAVADGRTLAVALLAALGSALACALAAIRQLRTLDGAAAATSGAGGDAGSPLLAALRDGGARGATSAQGARWRRALVGGEVALALVLLVGAGLLLRSAWALGRVAPGYDAEGVLTARLALPARDYPTVPRAVAGFDALLAAARGTPGVGDAALVSRVPLGGSTTGVDVATLDRVSDARARIPVALRAASDGYFRTLRIPLLAGRDLRAADRADAPAVVVVNAALAHRLAPGVPPARLVGTTLASDNGAFAEGGRPRPLTVVGVVGDVREDGPRGDAGPALYVPLAQLPEEPWEYWIARELLLVAAPAGAARAGGASAADDAGDRALALAPALRRAAAAVDGRVPLYDVRTTGARLAEALAVERLTRALLLALGGVGLALAALGIHGVVLHDVRRRTREVGIRLALGAAPTDAVTLLVRDGMRPVLVGLAVGGAAAAAGAPLARALLYGVAPLDPPSVLGAVAVLAAVSLASCWWPARRLAAVDPALPLRGE